MAQLTGADAGYEDASAYTASSIFQYNYVAFGQNIAYIGDRQFKVQPQALEQAVFKSNPFDAKADRYNYKTIASNTTVRPMTEEISKFKASPYLRSSDMANITIKPTGDLSAIGQRKSSLADTPLTFRILKDVERKNVKQVAKGESDSVVRRVNKGQYVWGTNNPKSFST